MSYPKRLIEVDLPIKRISAHARREKSIRHGHISTLHIWWARRPLAACRAVLCASLWPDPADEHCPKKFVEFAKNEMIKWSDNDHLQLLSKESIEHFIKVNHNLNLVNNNVFLRHLLLDFIADFANWDNGSNKLFIKTAQELTSISSVLMNGALSEKPTVLDPFAGGGSIPLEVLRIGGEPFASDLNPIPYLINKVQLEYIPRYGNRLSKDLKKIGDEAQKMMLSELGSYYNNPNDQEDSPLAFIWARSILCEGPNCGVKVPLVRNLWISKKRNQRYALFIESHDRENKLVISVRNNPKSIEVKEGTVKRGNMICPKCGFITPVSSTRKQLSSKNGGVEDSILLYTVHYDQKKQAKIFKSASETELIKYEKAKLRLASILREEPDLLPHEILPLMSGVFNVPIYGHSTWGSLFNSRQALSLIWLVNFLRSNGIEKIIHSNEKNYILALKTCMAFVIDRCADYWSTLAVWAGEFIAHTFGRQALGIVWDYAEANPLADSSGNFIGAINWVSRVIDDCSIIKSESGIIQQASATDHPMADDSVDYLFTDPPYYNAVPYSDLSDFFYVWLKRSIGNLYPNLFELELAPKKEEICEMAGWDPQRYSNKDSHWYEEQMRIAMLEARRVVKPGALGIIVFAHKSTKGWESQLKAMLDAGWIFTGSWPIDTERPGRLRANNSAALASSVHLVCRPRENFDGSLVQNQIGDWRDILEELPVRIHEWMPRLSTEGVAGADAIFACLGPALEIFSRYTKVLQSGSEREISLHEYLERVWAAVSQEAINMVFSGGEAQDLEEDARLTAMWLWTLTAGYNDDEIPSEDDEEVDEQGASGASLQGGYTLEYDTARKIAQGLGANLDELKSLVEIKGDKARLLPVLERTNKLFGSSGISKSTFKKKKKVQLTLSFENTESDEDIKYEIPELQIEQIGKTVLDRLHQAMLLFSTGRTEALKRFLVDDGAGKDDRFWKLAQALTSLYPKDTDERRWVEAVQTYKKNLGF